MALGGLLHDVGKARTCRKAILNKPGKLDRQRIRAKCSRTSMPGRATAAGQTPGVSEVDHAGHRPASRTLRRQRLSRTALAGKANISLYGQMAAIVDVYDAITSDKHLPQAACRRPRR
jgi:hypothetical protein